MRYFDPKGILDCNSSYITSSGKNTYELKFKCLDLQKAYYFFDDDDTKAVFLLKHELEENGEILLNKPSFHQEESGKTTNLAIKIKLIDANHCPGSCMFVFWIYRVTKTYTYLTHDFYIYTGDYYLNDTIKNKLVEFRKDQNKDEEKKVTIVNDNTRTSYKVIDLDDDRAFTEIKNFIKWHRKRTTGLITVVIGADWGMEDLWMRLAEEYSTYLFVDALTYERITQCMDHVNKKLLKRKEEEVKVNDFKNNVKYQYRMFMNIRFVLYSKNDAEDAMKNKSNAASEEVEAPMFDNSTSQSSEPITICVKPNFSDWKCFNEEPYKECLLLPYS